MNRREIIAQQHGGGVGCCPLLLGMQNRVHLDHLLPKAETCRGSLGGVWAGVCHRQAF